MENEATGNILVTTPEVSAEEARVEVETIVVNNSEAGKCPAKQSF